MGSTHAGKGAGRCSAIEFINACRFDLETVGPALLGSFDVPGWAPTHENRKGGTLPRNMNTSRLQHAETLRSAIPPRCGPERGVVLRTRAGCVHVRRAGARALTGRAGSARRLAPRGALGPASSASSHGGSGRFASRAAERAMPAHTTLTAPAQARERTL